MENLKAQKQGAAVLVLWAHGDPGIRSVGRTLVDLMAAEPFSLDAVGVDLSETVPGGTVTHTVASWVGGTLGSALLGGLGWNAVETQLAGRSVRLVVALDPLAAGTADGWRKEGRLHAPLVGVLGGLAWDPSWSSTAADRLVVADEILAGTAAEGGFLPEKVVPVGLPVCGGFSEVAPDDKGPLRRKFDLPERGPVVLCVTHGLSAEQVSSVLLQFSVLGDRATLLFDVAREPDIPDLLRQRSELLGISARMFGKVPQGGELWAASTMVVARPHRYVEQRAIALRLPLLCLPQNEAEAQTSRVFVQRNIGQEAGHLATLATQVETMLDRSFLEQARQAMGEISKRTAAQDVARFLAQCSASAASLLAEAREQAQGSTRSESVQGTAGPGGEAKGQPVGAGDGASPTARGARQQGPLEWIGASPRTGQVGTPASSTEPPDPRELEAAETEANELVSHHQRELQHWENRQQLAQKKGEGDLVTLAQKKADFHRDAMHQALAELARLSQMERPAGSQPEKSAAAEKAFRQLEVEKALAELKRKL